jgi:hypothetical protein
MILANRRGDGLFTPPASESHVLPAVIALVLADLLCVAFFLARRGKRYTLKKERTTLHQAIA